MTSTNTATLYVPFSTVIQFWQKQIKHMNYTCGRKIKLLQLKSHKCSLVCFMLTFGWFPGVCIFCAGVSEHSVCSIFMGYRRTKETKNLEKHSCCNLISQKLSTCFGPWCSNFRKSIPEHKHYGAMLCPSIYRGADKSLARPGRKQATATENFDVYISYL
jgi:hypothetical protein